MIRLEPTQATTQQKPIDNVMIMFCRGKLGERKYIITNIVTYYSKFYKDQTFFLFAEGPAYLIPTIL